jgi:serine/threonine protein kinase
MAPELIDPPPSIPFKRTQASDAWAFGCVCCEVSHHSFISSCAADFVHLKIWTEGNVPFSHLTDTQLILAISKFSTTGFQEVPYPMRPHDKGANPMPDRLWDLTQSCFLYEPFERPTVSVLADRICGMMPADTASRPSRSIPDTESAASTSVMKHMSSHQRTQGYVPEAWRPTDEPTLEALKPGRTLRKVMLPEMTFPRFLETATANTTRNLETCGLLLGREVVDNGSELFCYFSFPSY